MSAERAKPVAVVPAAGVGTRLRPHTHTIPKALVNVAGKPILAHIMDSLVGQGINRIILIVGYMGDRIRSYVERRYPGIAECVEQPEQLGLGHAVFLTRELVPRGPMMIILGDTIVHVDYASFLGGDMPVLGVKAVDDPHRFGIARVEDGLVTELVEKPENPPSNLALVGLYYLPESAELYSRLEILFQQKLTTRGEYQLTDALALMLKDGIAMKVSPVEEWFDCGKAETLLSTNEVLLARAPRNPEIPGVMVVHPVSIDPSAEITQSIIGPNVSVAAGAVIHNSIVRNTIINEQAEVRDMMLEGSLVGENAVVRGAFRRLNVGDSSQIALSGD